MGTCLTHPPQSPRTSTHDVCCCTAGEKLNFLDNLKSVLLTWNKKDLALLLKKGKKTAGVLFFFNLGGSRQGGVGFVHTQCF